MENCTHETSVLQGKELDQFPLQGYGSLRVLYTVGNAGACTRLSLPQTRLGHDLMQTLSKSLLAFAVPGATAASIPGINRFCENDAI